MATGGSIVKTYEGEWQRNVAIARQAPSARSSSSLVPFRSTCLPPTFSLPSHPRRVKKRRRVQNDRVVRGVRITLYAQVLRGSCAWQGARAEGVEGVGSSQCAYGDAEPLAGSQRRRVLWCRAVVSQTSSSSSASLSVMSALIILEGF